MEENKNEITKLQFFLGALVFIGGVVTIYVFTFTKDPNDLEIDEFGELHKVNSTGDHLLKIGLILLPIILLYYSVKNAFKKK